MLPRARWNLSFSTVTDNAHLYAEITPRLFCAKVFFNLDQPEGSWQSRSKVRHGNSTKKAPIFFTPLTSCQTLAKLGLHLIINMCFSFQESWTCGLLEMQTWESSWFAMQYYYVLLIMMHYELLRANHFARTEGQALWWDCRDASSMPLWRGTKRAATSRTSAEARTEVLGPRMGLIPRPVAYAVIERGQRWATMGKETQRSRDALQMHWTFIQMFWMFLWSHETWWT